MTTVATVASIRRAGNIWSIHPDATVFDGPSAKNGWKKKTLDRLVVMEGDELVGHHHRKALCAERCSQGVINKRLPQRPWRDHHGKDTSSLHSRNNPFDECYGRHD